MNRDYLIFGIAAFGIVSGMLSPIMIGIAKPLAEIFAASFLAFGMTGLVVFFGTLFAATLTIMFGGIPAALFERITGRQESDDISLYIWLAGTAILSLPAVTHLIGLISEGGP